MKNIQKRFNGKNVMLISAVIKHLEAESPRLKIWMKVSLTPGNPITKNQTLKKLAKHLTAKKLHKEYSEKLESKKQTQKILTNLPPTDKNVAKSSTEKAWPSKVWRTKFILKTLTTKILIARSYSEAIRLQKVQLQKASQ